jgi:hypothetical protein
MRSALLATGFAMVLLANSPVLAQAQRLALATPAEPLQPTTVAAAPAARRVEFTPDVIDRLAFLYHYIQETEFVVCLDGEQIDDVVHVDDFRLAHMLSTSDSDVQYDPCKGPRYVGTAHNHPPVEGVTCYRSIPDLNSWRRDTSAVVDAVFCGDRKYVWFTRSGARGGPGMSR